MSELSELKAEIKKIKERNRKVEADKAWETSLIRKLFLIILTYFVIVLTLLVIKNSDPYRNALVPALGFFLSTLTLPFIKTLWIKYIYRNN